jgi:hypothetical protein
VHSSALIINGGEEYDITIDALQPVETRFCGRRVSRHDPLGERLIRVEDRRPACPSSPPGQARAPVLHTTKKNRVVSLRNMTA